MSCLVIVVMIPLQAISSSYFFQAKCFVLCCSRDVIILVTEWTLQIIKIHCESQCDVSGQIRLNFKISELGKIINTHESIKVVVVQKQFLCLFLIVITIQARIKKINKCAQYCHALIPQSHIHQHHSICKSPAHLEMLQGKDAQCLKRDQV